MLYRTSPYYEEGMSCQNCTRVAEVAMYGYAQNDEAILLCKFHALQLARKILEDVCDIEGDRHG